MTMKAHKSELFLIQLFNLSRFLKMVMICGKENDLW